MWLERGTPALIAVLLAAVWLTGCGGFSVKGQSIGSNEPVWSDRAIKPGIADTASSVGSVPSKPEVADTASNGGALPPTKAVGSVPPKPGVAGAPPTKAIGSVRSAYTIGPADVLEISVFKVPELSKSVQVADTGTINLPLVGEVPAAGKTTQQLERDLTAKLGAKYLQNPQVTVMISQNNSQHVTVQGAVEKPGVYPIKGTTSLLELVALAGGLKDVSDSTVLVLRNSEGKRSAAKFNVADIQKGGAEDPVLQSDDVVVAGTSAIKQGFNTIMKALPLATVFTLL
jgi:polysaccharide export outer membrane protein